MADKQAHAPHRGDHVVGLSGEILGLVVASDSDCFTVELNQQERVRLTTEAVFTRDERYVVTLICDRSGLDRYTVSATHGCATDEPTR